MALAVNNAGPNSVLMMEAFPAHRRAAGLAVIHERVAPDQRIALGDADAARLVANAVCLGNALVMSDCSARLRDELGERGYRVLSTPLPSFLRSGGSAFCLTLRLDLRSTCTNARQAAVA